MVFEDYDGYGVDAIACGEVKEAMALNSLDQTVPVNDSASFGGDDNEKPAGTITGGGSGSGSGGSGSSSSRNQRKGNRDDQWKKDDKGWWFQFDDGTWPSDQWVLLDWNGTSLWYYFNREGYMVTGWFDQGGERYYLHAVSDGSLGGMYTGWHQIDGKWYYFNDISDGTRRIKKGWQTRVVCQPFLMYTGRRGVWSPLLDCTRSGPLQTDHFADPLWSMERLVPVRAVTGAGTPPPSFRLKNRLPIPSAALLFPISCLFIDSVKEFLVKSHSPL